VYHTQSPSAVITYCMGVTFPRVWLYLSLNKNTACSVCACKCMVAELQSGQTADSWSVHLHWGRPQERPDTRINWPPGGVLTCFKHPVARGCPEMFQAPSPQSAESVLECSWHPLPRECPEMLTFNPLPVSEWEWLLALTAQGCPEMFQGSTEFWSPWRPSTAPTTTSSTPPSPSQPTRTRRPPSPSWSMR
jgi:hypothetical protein